jgi:hypothetical protein
MSTNNGRITIDPKYQIDTLTKEVVNTRTGNAIPADEPRMLFRARDACTITMLETYYSACQLHGCSQEHLNSIQDRIHEFRMYQRAHAGQVKIPD